MAVAVIMSFAGAALLLLSAALSDVLGVWALPVAGPAAVVAFWLLVHSLPVVVMSARLRPLPLGATMIRSACRLTEDQEWELFRLVDLVKGRIWAVAPGAEPSGCEVWVLPHRDQVRRLIRARHIGVGTVGPAVCAVAVLDLRAPDACLQAIASGVAANAAFVLRGRMPAFLCLGLHGYLLCCALHPDGPDRRRCLHGEAYQEVGEGLDLATMLRRLAPSLRSPGARAVARSFVGFLIGRYGWRGYLRLMRYADQVPIDLALFQAYGRNLAELQERWMVFLEGSLAPSLTIDRQTA